MRSKSSVILHLFSVRLDLRARLSNLWLLPLRYVLDPYAVNVLIGLCQGMIKNDEDLKDLLDKLNEQLAFIKDKTQSLTDERFRPSRNSIQSLVKSLEAYILCVVFINLDSSLITFAGNWIRSKTSSSR
jgi:hypothetical protein